LATDELRCTRIDRGPRPKADHLSACIRVHLWPFSSAGKIELLGGVVPKNSRHDFEPTGPDRRFTVENVENSPAECTDGGAVPALPAGLELFPIWCEEIPDLEPHAGSTTRRNWRITSGKCGKSPKEQSATAAPVASARLPFPPACPRCRRRKGRAARARAR